MFLTIDDANLAKEDIERYRQFFNWFNHSLNRSEVVGGLDPIFTPATGFFPDDYNFTPTDTPSKPTVKPSVQHPILFAKKNGKIFDRVGESIRQFLKKEGFKVEVIEENSKKPKTRGIAPLHLRLIGQHLGLPPVEIINLAVTKLGTMPDPDGKLKELLRDIRKEGRDDNKLKQLIRVLHHRFHAPIGHYKNVLLSTDERLLDILSKSRGNIHYERLIQVFGHE